MGEMAPAAIVAFTIFCFALGACIGSFLNVVIWRLPYRGREVTYLEKKGKLTLSWPPSHCPVCDNTIHWYQNIPIVSWTLLRGKCANCKTGIAVRYPLVELGTAVLFAGTFLTYFAGHWPAPNGVESPGGFLSYIFTDIHTNWGIVVTHLLFIACLLAASAIDADLYIIPLSIPYLIMAIGFVSACLFSKPDLLSVDEAHWWLAKPLVGAGIGLVLANVLVWFGIMPRSFSEMQVDTVETKADSNLEGTLTATSDNEAKAPPVVTVDNSAEDNSEHMAPPPRLTKKWISLVPSVVIILLTGASWAILPASTASIVTVVAGIVIFFVGVLPRDAGQIDMTEEVLEEISMPHVRREVSKELLFLAIPLVCAIGMHLVPMELPHSGWLARLLGAVLGVIAGGSVVWLIRIGGTIAFNKEAMGLGDVHLMAGVGAILGGPLVIIAFFLSPFMAILWIVVLKILKKPNVLPFGPWLSVASIMCLFIGKALMTWYAIKLGLVAGPAAAGVGPGGF